MKIKKTEEWMKINRVIEIQSRTASFKSYYCNDLNE